MNTWYKIAKKIPEVANNHPQRIYVVKLLSELVTQIEKMPLLPQEVKMEETCCENSGEWQVISEAWSRITYTFLTKNHPLHQRNFLRTIQQTSSESPKAPSSILSQTLFIMNTLPSTLQTASLQIQLYSTQLYNFPLNVWYQPQVRAIP